MAYTATAYKESDRTAKLRRQAAEHEEKKPVYVSQSAPQLEQLSRELQQREPFAYDPEGDPLYGAYRDLYVRGGRLAMEDTMGKAAALTGGYGSSYGQAAGQERYNAWLQGLGEKLPELYGRALDAYTREGEALEGSYKLLSEQEDQEYSRYLDSLEAWMKERSYLAGQLETQEKQDYSRWAADRDFDYRAMTDQRKWDAEHPAYTNATAGGSGSAVGSGGSAVGSGSSGSSSGGTGSAWNGKSAQEKLAALEKNLAWVQNSASGQKVKQEQIGQAVTEAVRRGDVTAEQGEALRKRYSQPLSETQASPAKQSASSTAKSAAAPASPAKQPASSTAKSTATPVALGEQEPKKKKASGLPGR